MDGWAGGQAGGGEVPGLSDSTRSGPCCATGLVSSEAVGGGGRMAWREELGGGWVRGPVEWSCEAYDAYRILLRYLLLKGCCNLSSGRSWLRLWPGRSFFWRKLLGQELC